MDTIEISTSVFRQNQKKFLDLAKQGVNVLISRGTDVFQISPVQKIWESDSDTLTMLNESRRQIKDGKYTACNTKDELQAFFDSL